MALDKGEKEVQLKELTSIVTGIRLFNRECGKGGQGIDDCECRVWELEGPDDSVEVLGLGLQGMSVGVWGLGDMQRSGD